MDLKARRRALHTVLSEHLDGDALWKAIARWEDEYSGFPVFPTRFQVELAALPELRSKRAQLRRDLVQVLSRPESDLLADPAEEMRRYRARRQVFSGSPAPSPQQSPSTPNNLGGLSRWASASDSGRSPARRSEDAGDDEPVAAACSRLVSGLLDSMDAHAHSDVRRFVQREVSRSRISAPTRGRIIDWLREAPNASLSGSSIKELRQLINLVYVGLCESVGPGAADAHLAEAVSRLKRAHPELAKPANSLL